MQGAASLYQSQDLKDFKEEEGNEEYQHDIDFAIGELEKNGF